MLKIIKCDNYEDMSKKAFELIYENIKDKKDFKLGLATGSTPIGLYQNMVKAYNEGNLDFSGAKTVNLDEYVNIDSENSQSYRYFMNFNLFDRVNIDKNNTFIPKSDDANEDDCTVYNNLLDNFGTRDVQVLGIGPNGHLAFNEPGDKQNRRTSIVELTDETINANSRFFNSKDEVPRRAISMGLQDAFDAKLLVVLASGHNKKDAVTKFLNEGTIDPKFPMSFITLHPNCYLFVDKQSYPDNE